MKNVNFIGFRYYCSEYVRAQETAALLGFENAKWHVEFYLREQDRGVLAGKSVAEREKNYSDLVETVKRDTFYVAPPVKKKRNSTFSFVTFKKREENQLRMRVCVWTDYFHCGNLIVLGNELLQFVMAI